MPAARRSFAGGASTPPTIGAACDADRVVGSDRGAAG